MNNYRVLEIFKNKDLSFDFSGEYISVEELDREFFTIESIVKETMIKDRLGLAKKIKEGVITGLICAKSNGGNLFVKKIYVYKKDFKYVLEEFNKSTIELDVFLDSLYKLGYKRITRNRARDIFQRMGMFVTNPLNRRMRHLDIVKAENYKAKFIEINENYKSYEWVKIEIRKKYLGYEPNILSEIRFAEFFGKNNFNVLEFYSDYNFFGKQLYSRKGCVAYIKHFMKDKISYIKGDKQFFRTIDTLKEEDINTLYYTYEQLKQLVNEIGEEIPKKNSFDCFKRYKINVIRFISLMTSSQLFFRREEVDKLIIESKKYINKEQIKKELTELTDMTINVSFLKRRNINVYKAPTNLLKESQIYIKKSELLMLKEQLIRENEIRNAGSIYSIYKIKLSHEKILLKNIDIIKIFDEYVLDKSNKSETRDIVKMASIYAKVCTVINHNIDGNVMQLPLEYKIEKAKQLMQLSLDISDEVIKYLSIFLKTHLIPNVKLSVIKEEKIKDKVDKYSDDDFTTILISILGILDDPIKFKKLIYYRTASSAILYVLIHFVFAWRRNDIIEQLPKPNLKLIGYDDGIKFLEDLKNDMFIFEEYHGEKICKDITEYVYRMGLVSNKNKQQLEASIQANIYKHLGLLMCICEGNRQYCKKIERKRQNTETLISPGSVKTRYINETFLYFGIDIVGILRKPFSNLRGTKSFFSVLGERFEELEICVLKAVSELRAHKNDKENISNTGSKYYLQKDISKATVEIFSKETMGSVKDYILKLTDDDYDLLDDNKQIEKFKALKLGYVLI